MMESTTQRNRWSSRSAFILAAIGSAIGLGNVWRFPGLAARYGGGAFLLVFLITMFALGIPLLMMEIAVGRRMNRGAPSALRGMNKKFESIGWASTANAFVIVIYYAVVYAWVILMFVNSWQFAGMTGDNKAASALWANQVMTTWTTSGYDKISTLLLICLVIGWITIYACIRNGTSTVGKVVKYTVPLPFVCLIILGARGLTMPGGMEGVAKFFIPKFSALSNPGLWVDAIGQTFYSLSIMMCAMIAYGSYLDNKSNIAKDAMIIALADVGISVLAGVVMFSTMGGVGMLNNLSDSGIATAFVFYPQAIVNLTNTGWINALFAFVFYFCLVTLAVDSAFSLVEGVSASVSDRFKLNPKKVTIAVSVAAAVPSVLFITGAGVAWVDIFDNWANNYNLILIGALEAVAVGWCFKTSKVLGEVNKNTEKFKMPAWWFNLTLKVVAPVSLVGLLVWNIITLIQSGGVYGAASGYALWTNLVGGWLVTILVFVSGFIIKAMIRRKKREGFEDEELSWDDPPEDESAIAEMNE